MAIPYKKQFVKSDGRKLNRSGPRDMQDRASDSAATPIQNIGPVELLTDQLVELRAEILAMKSKSGDVVPTGFFSPEQVDEEIRRAVETAVAEAAISFKGLGAKNTDLGPLVKEYKEQILELQKGNDNLTKLHTVISRENSEFKEKIKKLESEIIDVSELKRQIAVLEQEVEGKEEIINILKTRSAVGSTEIIDPDRPQMEQVFVDPLEKDAGEGLEASIQIETVVKEDDVGVQVDKLKELLGKKLPT